MPGVHLLAAVHTCNISLYSRPIQHSSVQGGCEKDATASWDTVEGWFRKQTDKPVLLLFDNSEHALPDDGGFTRTVRMKQPVTCVHLTYVGISFPELLRFVPKQFVLRGNKGPYILLGWVVGS